MGLAAIYSVKFSSVLEVSARDDSSAMWIGSINGPFFMSIALSLTFPLSPGNEKPSVFHLLHVIYDDASNYVQLSCCR